MGAYRYVQPRLATAMRELSMAAFGVPPRALHYVGRPAAASAGAQCASPRLDFATSLLFHTSSLPRRPVCLHVLHHSMMWVLQPRRPTQSTWRRPGR